MVYAGIFLVTVCGPWSFVKASWCLVVAVPLSSHQRVWGPAFLNLLMFVWLAFPVVLNSAAVDMPRACVVSVPHAMFLEAQVKVCALEMCSSSGGPFTHPAEVRSGLHSGARTAEPSQP